MTKKEAIRELLEDRLKDITKMFPQYKFSEHDKDGLILYITYYVNTFIENGIVVRPSYNDFYTQSDINDVPYIHVPMCIYTEWRDYMMDVCGLMINLHVGYDTYSLTLTDKDKELIKQKTMSKNKTYAVMLARLGYKKAHNYFVPHHEDIPMTASQIAEELKSIGFSEIANDIMTIEKNDYNRDDAFLLEYRVKEFCNILDDKDINRMNNITSVNHLSEPINTLMAEIEEFDNKALKMLDTLDCIIKRVLKQNNAKRIDFIDAYVHNAQLKKGAVEYEYRDVSYGGCLPIKRDNFTIPMIYTTLKRIKTGKYRISK